MNWTEVGIDLLIFGACYAVSLILVFVWNIIFAPARLKREEKRKAGLSSLDQVLTPKADEAVKALDELMDADEEQ